MKTIVYIWFTRTLFVFLLTGLVIIPNGGHVEASITPVVSTTSTYTTSTVLSLEQRQTLLISLLRQLLALKIELIRLLGQSVVSDSTSVSHHHVTEPDPSDPTVLFFTNFNPDNLKFGSRLGVIHVGSQYPDRTAQGDMLVYGAKAAAALGFKTIEVFMDPRICRGAKDALMPGSLYQTNKYCDDTTPITMAAPDLKTLAAHPDYKAVFSNPQINRYVITFDPLNPKAANQIAISKIERAWTAEELQLLYNEVKQLTSYFLTTYSGTGKQFVLSAPSEMDWHLTGVGVERGGCIRGQDLCFKVDANPQAVQNTILYLNKIQEAITDAKRELNGKYTNIGVKQACEINFVVGVSPTLKTGLTEVIPHTKCDYVAWSAHEAWRGIQAQLKLNEKIIAASTTNTDPLYDPYPADLITKGLDRISQFPPLNKSVGYKDIMIGEIGFKENYDSLDLFVPVIKKALRWGVVSVDVWQLFDNTCSSFNPSATEAIEQKACKGFWLLKPGATKNSLVMSPLLRTLYKELAASSK